MGKGDGRGDGKKQKKAELREKKRANLLNRDAQVNLTHDNQPTSTQDNIVEEVEKKEVISTEVSATRGQAALWAPVQASTCRRGHHLLIKGFPCKIVDMSTSKTGKHGHAKIHFTALHIFTGKKHELLESSTHNVECPTVKRTEYSLVNIDPEGFCTLMCEDSSLKEDLKVPQGELGDKIKSTFAEKGELTVIVVASMGMEQIMEFRLQQ